MVELQEPIIGTCGIVINYAHIICWNFFENGNEIKA